MMADGLWRVLGRAASFGALCGITFVVCFPLIWALSTSLKPKSEIFATPPTLIPKAVTLENYAALATGRPQYFQSGGQQVDSGSTPAQFFTRWFFNSIVVTAGSTLISIVVSTLAAYSLTRFRYWGRGVVPYFSLLGYMVPSIIFVFPLFLLMVKLNLTDTLFSLVLGYVCVTLPFCMWLMWAFMRSIPIEIEEAALVDGATRLQVFRDVVLPTAFPGIIAAAIFAMIVSWTDYLFG
jgi:multiple sugar transport system permease protein